MNSIKIEIQSDGLNQEQSEYLAAFINSLGQINTPKAFVVEAPEFAASKLEQPKPKRAKKEVIQEPEAPIEEIEVVEAEVVSGSLPSLMDIKTLVAEKQAEHKTVLRAKLQEFGAANVSTLDPAHYIEFYELLKSLN